MLSTFHDPAALFALFDAPGPAVRATIERDGWGGMLWPGHPKWTDPAMLRPDDVRAGDQLLSLALLKELEPTLVDAGPTSAMAELGANVQQLKDALQALAAKPLSQADIVRHTDLTNRTAFGLVQACLEAEVPPGLVANVFL